ncbi:MAG TPA: helix-hairpin-helix domain-containing protein [Flavobacteriales bacterium]|nr:helix-hairpin-helix domain-containing protein [Flavobacteriales bacterium]HIO16504.1 helix-hairpin-helix domain-containing protein [Flavobacteriales bacterium]HIO59838.1 helix-hairpin-helix domain-containing protein [Flavobacteriales bacterium]
MFNTKNDNGSSSNKRDELFHLTSIVIVISLSLLAWGLESMRAPSYEDVIPNFLTLLEDWPLELANSEVVTFTEKQKSTSHYIRESHYKKNITHTLSNSHKPVFHKPAPKSLDLNLIDSVTLESLPVFGPVLSGRTIKFRNALGGFCEIEQLKEVYGIDSSSYQQVSSWFRISSSDISKICVDTASWDKMRRHPYIGVNGARIIERYRRHHDLATLADVRNIPQITDSIWAVWLPYIKISPKNDIK